MKNYREATYGERIAGIYDAWYPDFDEAMVDTLAELANGGPAWDGWKRAPFTGESKQHVSVYRHSG